MNCNHDKTKPEFDLAKAKTMTVEEVRKHYPRFFGECPDCKRNVIAYASTEHFVYGDW